MNKQFILFLAIIAVVGADDALIIATLVGTLGSAISGGFAGQAASDTARANRNFQASQSEADRLQNQQQFNTSMAQRKAEFEAEAPVRAVNVFNALKPALDEQRKKKDLATAWSFVGKGNK